MDKDGDGFIDTEDLKQVFVELGMKSETLDDDCDLLIKVLEPIKYG